MFRRESSLSGVIAVNRKERLDKEAEEALNAYRIYLNNLSAENIKSFENIQSFIQNRHNNLAEIQKVRCNDTKIRKENEYIRFTEYLQQINELLESHKVLNTKLIASPVHAPSAHEFLNPLKEHITQIHLYVANALASVLARPKLTNESMETIALLKEAVDVANKIYANPYAEDGLQSINNTALKLHNASASLLCPHARSLTKKIALTLVCSTLIITGLLIAASLVLNTLPLMCAVVIGVGVATLLTSLLATREVSSAYYAGYSFWNKSTSNTLKPIESELYGAHHDVGELQKAFPQLKKGA